MIVELEQGPEVGIWAEHVEGDGGRIWSVRCPGCGMLLTRGGGNEEYACKHMLLESVRCMPDHRPWPGNGKVATRCAWQFPAEVRVVAAMHLASGRSILGEVFESVRVLVGETLLREDFARLERVWRGVLDEGDGQQG